MRKPRNIAFTLTQILVAVGVIVLVLSLAIPALFQRSERLRVVSDLQSLAAALDAYKQDSADYPRLGLDANGYPEKNTGAAILGKALLGPYGDGVPLPPADATTPDPKDPPDFLASTAYGPGDCVRHGGHIWLLLRSFTVGGNPPSDTNPDWTKFTATDHLDGPGFKLPAGATKTMGPYINSGKTKSQGVFLLDVKFQPILYFPARVGSGDVSKSAANDPQPYVDVNPAAPTPMTSLYDASDNLEFFRRTSELPSSVATDKIALNRIRIMLGDYNCNGYIDNGETAVKQPYLLWSTGPDFLFGPANYTPDPANPTANKEAVEKCDDVTNFK